MTTAVPARLVLAAVLVAAVGAPARAETPIPPAPARWLTDRAGFLSAAAAADLDARLELFERASGHQLVVYVDRTTGGVPIEDWAVRAFEAWRVGRKGLDDGAALFLFSDDRRVRIEVGYGLESSVPDARAKQIIDGQIVPRLRAGDRDEAVRAGVAALMKAIGGGGEAASGLPAVGQPDGGAEGAPRAVPSWMVIAGGVGLLLLFLLALRHPGLAWFLLYTISSGRGGGGGGWGGGGGGGGFSGGGGRSGGGGASGSW